MCPQVVTVAVVEDTHCVGHCGCGAEPAVRGSNCPQDSFGVNVLRWERRLQEQEKMIPNEQFKICSGSPHGWCTFEQEYVILVWIIRNTQKR